jgi:hypothetical protein
LGRADHSKKTTVSMYLEFMRNLPSIETETAFNLCFHGFFRNGSFPNR